jgi:hypothetical protein
MSPGFGRAKLLLVLTDAAWFEILSAAWNFIAPLEVTSAELLPVWETGLR